MEQKSCSVFQRLGFFFKIKQLHLWKQVDAIYCNAKCWIVFSNVLTLVWHLKKYHPFCMLRIIIYCVGKECFFKYITSTLALYFLCGLWGGDICQAWGVRISNRKEACDLNKHEFLVVLRFVSFRNGCSKINQTLVSCLVILQFL